MVTNICALPKISTLALSSPERALGRLVPLSVSREPDGPAQSDLAGDGFYSLYKATPDFREPAPPERAINHALLKWTRSLQGWEQGRAHTVANLPAAMAAAGLLWESLTSEEALQEALKKQEEAAKKARQADEQEALAAGYQAAGMDDQAQACAAQAEAARQAAQADAQAGLASLEQAQADAMAQAAVAQATRQAGQAGQETARAMAGWGLGPGSDVRTDPQAALEFARRQTDRLRRIAELAGRMRGIALQARRERVVHGPIPAVAGLTRDLTKVFPSELALLRSDAPAVLRAQQVARWAEGGLLGWQLRRIVQRGRRPGGRR
jgi:hypothetical protein